ncbi:MAG: prephenate dehydratase domain-containing protein [Snowella sp.]|nr:prephenate dehydratase domain-containing protein [Snowella sp.]
MLQAIASPRAAQLYDLPTLATDINDYPDNCTRFWV